MLMCTIESRGVAKRRKWYAERKWKRKEAVFLVEYQGKMIRTAEINKE